MHPYITLQCFMTLLCSYYLKHGQLGTYYWSQLWIQIVPTIHGFPALWNLEFRGMIYSWNRRKWFLKSTFSQLLTVIYYSQVLCLKINGVCFTFFSGRTFSSNLRNTIDFKMKYSIDKFWQFCFFLQDFWNLVWLLWTVNLSGMQIWRFMVDIESKVQRVSLSDQSWSLE